MSNLSPLPQHYYTNPAFCQQSEFGNFQQLPKSTLNSQRSLRQSPVGAQSPGINSEVPATINDGTKLTTTNDRYVCYGDNDVNVGGNFVPSNSYMLDNEYDFEEQEFYEEMVVDDKGLVKTKKVVVVSNLDAKNGNTDNYKYVRVPNNNNLQARQNSPAKINRQLTSYTDDDIINSNARLQKHRYEYIPLKGHGIRRSKSFSTPPKRKLNDVEDVVVGNGKVHRYAVISMEDETDLTNDILEQKGSPTRQTDQGRYDVRQYGIQDNRSRYDYLSPPYQEYQQDLRNVQRQPAQTLLSRQDNSSNQPSVQSIRRVMSPQSLRKNGNPVATQKLHELLTTPRKTPQRCNSVARSSQETTPTQQTANYLPPLAPVTKSPFVTSVSLTNRSLKLKAPKAQQKLNYALSTRQLSKDKRHTAIVTPICSSPVQSVYSDTTFSNKSESWMNLSINKKPVHATMTVAAVTMVLCGGLTSALCFYMVSVMGRLYYLDFGIVSGFACLLLGLLGFRSRSYYYWLPNRNYISGYIILTLFSLLTCVGLLVLLFKQPKPGSPLADMTSGAVCGISVLSLVLASIGVISSYCCKFPPPDNRVEHCAQGFVV